MVAAGGLLLGLVIVAPLAAASGRSARVPRANGVVYVESNSPHRGANQILAFRYHDGVLSGRHVRRYSTGGSGSHDLSNSGVLDSDQELIVNPSRTLLFGVNWSSDSIAVFHIEKGGALRAVAGSPFPSHGKAPASLGLAGRTYRGQQGPGWGPQPEAVPSQLHELPR